MNDIAGIAECNWDRTTNWCTRCKLSFAATFALRTADKEASAAPKGSRRRLDSRTGRPFLGGDPCRYLVWIIQSTL